MDRWVGIATVCTAIASIVIGLITVWVMLDQQKNQNELIEYQKCEHQPTFIVEINKHYGEDKSFNDASYEDLKINCVGNQQYIIVDIKINTYITLKTNYYKNPIVDRIRLYDYFNIRMGKDENAILTATSNRDKRNFAKYISMKNCLYNLPRTERNIHITKDIMVEIEYIDVYQEKRKKYFQNGLPVDETTYLRNSDYKFCNEYSIDDFDLLEYLKRHNLQIVEL